MSAAAKLHSLRDFLSQFRFNFTSEAELQTGIEQALAASSFRVQREYRLSEADRLDFLIDDELVIEVKIGSSTQAVQRQLWRYAQNDLPQGFLLVTNRAGHMIPHSFNGKPCLVHSLLDGAF